MNNLEKSLLFGICMIILLIAAFFFVNRFVQEGTTKIDDENVSHKKTKKTRKNNSLNSPNSLKSHHTDTLFSIDERISVQDTSENEKYDYIYKTKKSKKSLKILKQVYELITDDQYVKKMCRMALYQNDLQGLQKIFDFQQKLFSPNFDHYNQTNTPIITPSSQTNTHESDLNISNLISLGIRFDKLLKYGAYSSINFLLAICNQNVDNVEKMIHVFDKTSRSGNLLFEILYHNDKTALSIIKPTLATDRFNQLVNTETSETNMSPLKYAIFLLSDGLIDEQMIHLLLDCGANEIKLSVYDLQKFTKEKPMISTCLMNRLIQVINDKDIKILNRIFAV